MLNSGPSFSRVVSADILRVLSFCFVVFCFFLVAISFYHYYEHWSVNDCLFFMISTMTTVGYGYPTPSDNVGRVVTIFFIILGFFLIFIGVNYFVNNHLEWIQSYLCRNSHRQVKEDIGKGDIYHYRKQLIWIVIIAFVWLVIGAIVLKYNEDWDWITAFYFITQTISTVGYGDIPVHHASSISFLCFYIVISAGILGAIIRIFHDTNEESELVEEYEQQLLFLQSLPSLVSAKNLNRMVMTPHGTIQFPTIIHPHDLIIEHHEEDETSMTMRSTELLDHNNNQRIQEEEEKHEHEDDVTHDVEMGQSNRNSSSNGNQGGLDKYHLLLEILLLTGKIDYTQDIEPWLSKLNELDIASTGRIQPQILKSFLTKEADIASQQYDQFQLKKLYSLWSIVTDFLYGILCCCCCCGICGSCLLRKQQQQHQQQHQQHNQRTTSSTELIRDNNGDDSGNGSNNHVRSSSSSWFFFGLFGRNKTKLKDHDDESNEREVIPDLEYHYHHQASRGNRNVEDNSDSYLNHQNEIRRNVQNVASSSPPPNNNTISNPMFNRSPWKSKSKPSNNNNKQQHMMLSLEMPYHQHPPSSEISTSNNNNNSTLIIPTNKNETEPTVTRIATITQRRKSSLLPGGDIIQNRRTGAGGNGSGNMMQQQGLFSPATSTASSFSGYSPSVEYSPSSSMLSPIVIV